MDTFDEFGNCHHRVQSTFHELDPTNMEDAAKFASYHAHLHKIHPSLTGPDMSMYSQAEFVDGDLYFASQHARSLKETLEPTLTSLRTDGE